MRLSLRTAALIAYRETRSSLTKFLFVVLAVAAGVGALSGVRGFSQSFHAMLTREARTVMAADLTARQFIAPSPDQIESLDDLSHQGVDRTLVTETFSMAAPAGVASATPALVAIKAVDPAKYPYYGTVQLQPSMPLADALKPDTIAAGDDVLIRLHAKVGDLVHIGGQNFRVSAVVVSEPDRMSGGLNIGLRVLMSGEALDRTGLMSLGSRATRRYLFKLGPSAPAVARVRRRIHQALPEAAIADFRQSNPIITNGLDRATIFLSLISLIALIVGALGVGMAMHAHLEQKMDNIAVMKSLGATSGEIIRIFTLQTLMLGALGGLLGVMLGHVVEMVFPAMIAKYFAVDITSGWHLAAAGQGIGVGILTTLLFTVPPLLAIRRIRPALILRRGMAEMRGPLTGRLKNMREALVAGAVILVGIGFIASWLADSPKIGGYFAGGLAGSLLALTAVAWALLRGIRAGLARWRMPSLLRQGFANIYRQGAQSQTVLVALGLGVMFTLSVYLVQKSLVAQIVETAPPGSPNVFLVGITPAQVGPLKKLTESQPGVEGEPEFVSSIAARLTGIDGVPLSPSRLEGEARRYRFTGSVRSEAEKPEFVKLLEGRWWPSDTTQNEVSVSEDAAKALNLKPGSTIQMQASGRTIDARVVAIHEFEAIRVRASTEFMFSPPALAGLPEIFYGGVRMKPSEVGAYQRAAFERFPTVTVVNVADALQIVQQVVDQIALVIRFLSAFAILAGAIILSASVAGSRFRRIREVVILKTLGATRRHIGRIFSIEFLTIGTVAGLMGGLLAALFSNMVMKRLLNAKFEFSIVPTIVAMVLTALLANASGWLVSYRILKQKPLEVLRDE